MGAKLPLKLQSSVFKQGGRIPDKYTCDGENISPPLNWSRTDSSVMSWALIMDDPDASRGVFTHWVIYNIPAGANSLSEGLPTHEVIQSGALQGMNDTMKPGYAGPCPPPGPVHHYDFNLYALDNLLNVGTRASKKQVLDAMKGHILSQGKITGVYQRT